MTTAAQVCREIAFTIERIQQDIDTIDELLEGDFPPVDFSKTIIHTDPNTGKRTGLKFKDIEDAACFMRDLLNKGDK